MRMKKQDMPTPTSSTGSTVLESDLPSNGSMNCFVVSPKLSPRKKGVPPALNIPTICEIHDVSGYLKRRDSDALKFPLTTSSAYVPEQVRRLSFRLGSDAEESNNSSSQRTTPSYSAGNSVFDFEYSLAQSDSSCTTPSPKVLSAGQAHSMTPGTVFLDIPRDPFQLGCGPIANSHSSDKLASCNIPTPPALNSPISKTKIHISRSCSMLTKGVFGGKGGVRIKERQPVKRCSSQTDKDAELSKASSADTSRKSSEAESVASDSSIFARLMQRWHTYQNSNGSSVNTTNAPVPAHAQFLKYQVAGEKKNKAKAKSARSHSETEAVEKTVKARLRHLVRRNTESVLKEKNAAANRSKSSDNRNANSSSRPTPEEARSWQESFDTLLANNYGTALFRAFLKLEYNEENLAFYLACEKFKRLDASSQRKMVSKAQKIYDEFIRVEAPREVNLDSITRATTVTNLANPNRHCFDHAQRRVRHVLEKDVYPRFLQFDLYTQLLVGPPVTSSGDGNGTKTLIQA